MDFGVKLEELGKNLIVHFKKDTPGWKRFASELIDSNVILDVKNAKKMLEKKGDLIVYEVYHLWKSMSNIRRVYEKTGIICDITLLNFGMFSTSDDGELFLTHGHLHEKPMGEFQTVLKNDCFILLADMRSKKTCLVKLKEGDSILIHPKYLHRTISSKKDCLFVTFSPDKAGHNYEIVKNRGFPFHIFLKNKKLKVLKNKKYKGGKFELVKKTASKVNPVKLFEKNPNKLKEILENPEKYRKLYFMEK